MPFIELLVPVVDVLLEGLDDPVFLQRLCMAIAIAAVWALLATVIQRCGLVPNDPMWTMHQWRHQYGPTLYDWALATKVVKSARHQRTQLRNARIVSCGTERLSTLPNELFLDICDWVGKLSCPHNQGRGSCHRCRQARRDLARLSMTSRCQRERMAGLLLTSIKIKREHWWEAHRALDGLNSSLSAHQHTKELKLYFNFGDRSPPAELFRMLATTLPLMLSLETLGVVTPRHYKAAFAQALDSQNVVLRRVRTLKFGPHLEFLIHRCPNAEAIICHHYGMLTRGYFEADRAWDEPFPLIAAAGMAPRLRHLEIDMCWQTKHVRAVTQRLPQLQSLSLPLNRPGRGIEHFLPILAKLENLKVLFLGHFSRMKYSCDLEDYHDVMHLIYDDDEDEASAQSLNTSALNVFNSVPSLEEIWYGNHDRATVARDCTRGIVDVTWSRACKPREYERDFDR
jgi:hypothetical protein